MIPAGFRHGLKAAVADGRRFNSKDLHNWRAWRIGKEVGCDANPFLSYCHPVIQDPPDRVCQRCLIDDVEKGRYRLARPAEVAEDCPFLAGNYLLSCKAAGGVYVPSRFEFREYCKGRSYTICPHYLRASAVQRRPAWLVPPRVISIE